jgi:nicotinate dehydrogenase subunit B
MSGANASPTGRSDQEMNYEIEPERYELSEGPAYRFDLDRRDFVKILGGGLVVVLTLRDALAQETGGGQRGGGGNAAPQEISAWIQVAEDGTINVCTGKTEVGQNIRTTLSQVAADELRVPVTSIRMIMADTDLTPFDQGTFGSRSVPTMAPQIRRAAAAARESLIDLAAQQLKVDRIILVCDGGKVTNPDTKQSLTFAEVTKGQKLVKTIMVNVRTAAPDQWKITGRSERKVNGREMVTGKHRYTSDIKRPGMVVGKVFRAPAYNSTLVSADTKKAESIGGVKVVRDGEFLGVTAPNELIASQALSAINARWDSKPHLSEKELYEALKKTDQGRPTERGSIEQGMAQADHKLQETYKVAYIAHVPLEPRAAVAEWSADGKLTVWTGTQRPFGVRSELAQAFRIPEDRIRVIVPDTGSGYGGKHTGETAIEAARLAKTAGKPVKLVWTREEEFKWAYFRPAGVIDISSGVKKDGTVTAWEYHNYNSGNSAIAPLYDFANTRIAYHPVDSPLRQGSYKGLAATANHFARESHMDVLAKAVGMDPLQFRYKNIKDPRLRAVYEAGAEKFVWGRDKSSPERGHGLAGGFEKGGYVSTFAEIAIDRNRQVKIVRVVAAFECGAVINPDQLKNQIEGAVVMGIGGALFEAIHFEGGKILNPVLAKYRVPRFSDIPTIEVVILDRKDLPSAGAGETPIVGLAPAVGNAIAAATGVRVRQLPMVPNGLERA